MDRWTYVIAGGASYLLILYRTFSSALRDTTSINASRFPQSVFTVTVVGSRSKHYDDASKEGTLEGVKIQKDVCQSYAYTDFKELPMQPYE